ncbi:MAG: hypothetical protein RMJ53_08120 [Chitinophagales bacterium]|nr:hypothetical protein [Chitinophagales bacterium]
MKYNLILISAVIAILLIMAYSNHWNNDFHFDDSHTVQNNIFIRSIKNIPLFFKDCSTFSSIPSHGSYRPVVSTTLALDYFLAQTFSGNGYQTFWYHLSTFIFFLLQLFLMYFFYAKILSTTQNNSGYRLVGLFAVGWYALNPVMAETINYVISRSDSISTFFRDTSFYALSICARCKKILFVSNSSIYWCSCKTNSLNVCTYVGCLSHSL